MENWVQEGEQTIGMKNGNEVATCSPDLYLPYYQQDKLIGIKIKIKIILSNANCKFRDGKNMADLLPSTREILINSLKQQALTLLLLYLFLMLVMNWIRLGFKVGAGWSNYEEMVKARQAGYQHWQ